MPMGLVTKPPNGYLYASEVGAVGDGATDDTAALQTLIDEATAGEKTPALDGGTYRITSTLEIGAGGTDVPVGLVGFGRPIVRWAGADGTDYILNFDWDTGSGAAAPIWIRGIQFYGNNKACGLSLNTFTNWMCLSDCFFWKCKEALVCEDCWGARIERLVFLACGALGATNGIVGLHRHNGGTFASNQWVSCDGVAGPAVNGPMLVVTGNPGAQSIGGVYQDLMLDQCVVGAGAVALHFDHKCAATIRGVRIENVASLVQRAIHLEGCEDVLVENVARDGGGAPANEALVYLEDCRRCAVHGVRAANAFAATSALVEMVGTTHGTRVAGLDNQTGAGTDIEGYDGLEPGQRLYRRYEIDHSDFTDNGDTYGRYDLAPDLPAGSEVVAVRVDVSEAFDSTPAPGGKAVLSLGNDAGAVPQTDFTGTTTWHDVSGATTLYWTGGDIRAAGNDPLVTSATGLRLVVNEDDGGGGDWGSIDQGAVTVELIARKV